VTSTQAAWSLKSTNLVSKPPRHRRFSY
jgi:hypothetical protein